MYPSQLKQFLSYSIPNKYPVMITGQPGIGKTEIIKEVVSSLKDHQLLISHPVVSDPTDFKGMPFVTNGSAEFLPFGDLKQLIDADKPLIHFLDDFGQASTSVQAAAMQLILERRINGHKISDNVVFMAATNRHTDRAGVSGILEPVKSRFMTILELEVNIDDWIEWATKKGLPPELVSFIRFKPKMLSDFQPSRELKNSPTPRTIYHVGEMMNSGLDKSFEFEVFSGAAGEGFATEFRSYLTIYRDLPDPREVLKNPTTAIVPKELSQKYAISGAISHIVKEDNFKNFITYIDRLPVEFKISAFRDAIARNAKLLNNPDGIKWLTENSAILVGSR
jgi:hypothetical protein